MSAQLAVSIGALCALLLVLPAVAMLRTAEDRDRLARRIERARGQVSRGRGGAPAGPRFDVLRVVATIGRTITRSGVLSGSAIADLEQTLSSSGFRAESALGIFVGTKILLLLSLPAVSWALLLPDTMSPLTFRAALAGSAVMGLMAPDWAIRKLRKRYLDGVERGLPDALDLLVICAQAGLALEPAVARVANEIRMVHPTVSKELEETSNELQVMSDSVLALTQLGTRTGLDSLKRIAMTLAQTLQYGTPLTDALRILSADMRQEALVRYEEKAARLPVMLTLPMIVFILPCVFIIVGGPAVIQVFRQLGQ
jgi:tight adherence protein C